MLKKQIPAMSSKKFVSLLEKGGAVFVRQRKTSHAIFQRIKDKKVYRAPVVMNKKELSPKYIKLVFRQLGFTDEEIDGLL
ncbi:type II toxin-antitoxin system HicA family toxin [bacterium]|nr:type II toxin-antitoxin system HicA family toxin [bacterium]MBU1615488.1 type II toxin-antitoxin system HicA family toxin [bacterium]